MYEQAPNPTELNDKIKVNEQQDMIFANNGINMPFYYINNSDRYSAEEKDFLTEWCKTWNNSMKYKLDELPDFHVSYVFSCLLALYDQTGVLEYPKPMTEAEQATEKIYMPLVKDFCKKLNDQVQGMVTEREQQKQDDFDKFTMLGPDYTLPPDRIRNGPSDNDAYAHECRVAIQEEQEHLESQTCVDGMDALD